MKMKRIVYHVSPDVARKILKSIYGVDPKKPLKKEKYTHEELDEIQQLLDTINQE